MDIPAAPLTECWPWKGAINNYGYGKFRFKGKRVMAHRFAYELTRGKIPNGMTIDHVCRVRSCVRPSHLEVVSRGENTLRGVGPAAMNARKTLCPKGHAFNVITTRGDRRCSICWAEHHRNWRHKNHTAYYAYRRALYAANPEKARAQARASYWRRSEKIKAHKRDQYAAKKQVTAKEEFK